MKTKFFVNFLMINQKQANSPQTNWFYEKELITYIEHLIQSSPIFDYGIDKEM